MYRLDRVDVPVSEMVGNIGAQVVQQDGGVHIVGKPEKSFSARCKIMKLDLDMT